MAAVPAAEGHQIVSVVLSAGTSLLAMVATAVVSLAGAIIAAFLTARGTIRGARQQSIETEAMRLRYEVMSRRLEMFDTACLEFLTATRDAENILADRLDEIDEIRGAAMLVCGPQWEEIRPKWETFLERTRAGLNSLVCDKRASLEALEGEVERLKQGQPASDRDLEKDEVRDDTMDRLADARAALFELCSSVDNIAMHRLARAGGPNGSA